MDKFYDYGVDIACLSEGRLPNFGSRSSPDKRSLLDVSVDQNTIRNFMVLRLQRTTELTAPRPLEKLFPQGFRKKPFNLTITEVFATLQAQPTAKDPPYSESQGLANRILRSDIVLTAEDWSSRKKLADEYIHHILKGFGLGERCENDNHLVAFADLNLQAFASTCLQHPIVIIIVQR